MVFISLLAGALGLGNYYLVMQARYGTGLALVIQVVMTLIALVALLGFRGRKSRPSYVEWGVRFFTIRFVVALLAFLGNAILSVVLYLNMTGRLQGF